MINPTLAIFEQRLSVNRFDPGYAMGDTEIEALMRLTTRAPTAYNLQNWRFIAVRTSEAKARLRRLAYGQAKVTEAAVTFVVCGQQPNHLDVPHRLRAFVEAGFMSAEMVVAWQESVRDQYSDPQASRDETVRSATLGATTLMFAAQAMGLASCPMAGFDAAAVAHEFGLQNDELPVLLVTVGRAAPGNWPQKPRRPLAEVLQCV